MLHEISLPDKVLISFTNSDDNGFYSLKIENTNAHYSLNIKAPSFKTIEQSLNLPPGVSFLRKDFILHSSVSYLDTVKVNIKMTISKTGDTITFNPNAFALKNETNIQELLSRLPGMEIKEDGKIFFNGKLVNGVLIEGDDLFKRNYQLLTQNAASKIVGEVQVFKNYQKDRLLKEFNQYGSQVINLKIKDQYKNYVFGNGTLGYGNKGNKQADLFLIRLSSGTKVQFGGNYNTTGTTYAPENKFDPNDLIPSENFFFSFQPASSLLDVYRYYFQNIPGYYQDRNKSIQGYTNLLFKKNKWESVLNVKYAEDKLKDDQELQNIYNDGTLLFTGNHGLLRDQLQDYNYTASKSAEKESLHINVSLQNKHRSYGLQTSSNQSLETNQQLKGGNLSWQLNVNYNRKLKNNLLWTSTLGYFNQSNNENLETNPDFLFWLFPDSLSLYSLFSTAGVKLQYLDLKTGLLLNNKKMTHEISVTYSREKQIFQSELQTKDLTGDKQEIPFSNDSKLQNHYLQIQYKGGLRLSGKNRLNMSITNEPHFFSYRLSAFPEKVTNLFYDYTMGLSTKTRTSNIGLNIGIKRQFSDFNLFFPDFIQTGFHHLQSGRMDTYGVKSAYLQASYSLISLKLGWIAFFLLNVSHDKSDFIRNMETKGIATVSSFSYFPNSTNQMFFIFNSRKTLGELPFSLNSNLTYNRRLIYDGFNGLINKSDFQFLNMSIGIKSQFKP